MATYETPRMSDYDSHDDYLVEMQSYAAMIAANDPLRLNGQIAESVLRNYGITDEETK